MPRSARLRPGGAVAAPWFLGSGRYCLRGSFQSGRTKWQV